MGDRGHGRGPEGDKEGEKMNQEEKRQRFSASENRLSAKQKEIIEKVIEEFGLIVGSDRPYDEPWFSSEQFENSLIRTIKLCSEAQDDISGLQKRKIANLQAQMLKMKETYKKEIEGYESHREICEEVASNLRNEIEALKSFCKKCGHSLYKVDESGYSWFKENCPYCAMTESIEKAMNLILSNIQGYDNKGHDACIRSKYAIQDYWLCLEFKFQQLYDDLAKIFGIDKKCPIFPFRNRVNDFRKNELRQTLNGGGDSG